MNKERKIFEIPQFSLQFSYKLVWQSILDEIVWIVTLVCSKSCITPSSTRCIFTIKMSCTLKGNIPIVSIMLTTFLSPSFLRNEFTKCSRVLLK